MRLEIPDGFDIGPLMHVIALEAARQHHQISGEVLNGEAALVFKPHLRTVRQLPLSEHVTRIGQQLDAALNFELLEGPARTQTWQQTTGRGWELLRAIDQAAHPKVVHIFHRKRAAHACGPMPLSA